MRHHRRAPVPTSPGQRGAGVAVLPAVLGAFLAARLVLDGDQRVEDRHDEQREERADDHAGDEHDADAVARLRARPGDEHQREVTEDRRRRRHQHRTQARLRRFAQRCSLREPALLQRVGELDDQDAVLRDQADQRDQPDLRVDVDRRQVEEAEQQRARDRERHGTEQHDQRIAEAAELRREHQVDEHEREPERHDQRRPLAPDLSRFAGVVERHRAAGDRARRVLEHAQALFLGDARLHAAEDADGVALLEAIQRARRGARSRSA
jgi:hypothetical protein